MSLYEGSPWATAYSACIRGSGGVASSRQATANAPIRSDMQSRERRLLRRKERDFFIGQHPLCGQERKRYFTDIYFIISYPQEMEQYGNEKNANIIKKKSAQQKRNNHMNVRSLMCLSRCLVIRLPYPAAPVLRGIRPRRRRRCAPSPSSGRGRGRRAP